MPSLAPQMRFFKKSRQCYEINPPDQMHNVVYLGNVLTIMAKGDQSIERPLQAIWSSYSTRKRDVAMKLSVTRQGLKVETKELGITEYWAHRITYCYAPAEYPRVFCWVYKHEGKRMKPELRCHAVLCRKRSEPTKIAETLTNYLHAALQEYKREKLAMEKARKSVVTGTQNGEILPRRKMLLQSGTLNFRPPVNRSKSAPRLGSIDEEDEIDEEKILLHDQCVSDYEFDETSDAESFGYRGTPLLGGPPGLRSSNHSFSQDSTTSTSTQDSSTASGPTSNQNTFRRQLSLCSANRKRFAESRLHASKTVNICEQDEYEEGVVLEEDELPAEDILNEEGSSTSSCASLDDGFGSSASHNSDYTFKQDYPQAPQNSPNYAEKSKTGSQITLTSEHLSTELSNELTQLCRVSKRPEQSSIDSDVLLSDESGFSESKSAPIGYNSDEENGFNNNIDPAQELFTFLCLIIGASALSRDGDVRHSLKLAHELKQTLPEDLHQDFEKFTQFINQYKRKYNTAEEIAQRFANIQKSLKRIAELSESNPEATYGLTKFSDYSKEELTRITGLIHKAKKVDPSEYLIVGTDDVPDSFDWKEHDGVTPVRDQGECGSCFVFGSLAAIKSQRLIHKNLSSYLSVEEVLDCTYEVKEYGSEDGCDGGFPDNPSATFALNQFSDYTEEERNMLNGLIYEPSRDDTVEYLTVDTDDVPDAYDWREHNGVTPVRYQGGCGSCYVFGSLAAIESQLLIHKNISSYLSVEEVLACTYYDKQYNEHGCDGGYPEAVFNFVKDRGVTDDDHWKYDSSIHNFTGMCNMTGKPIITKIKSFHFVPNDAEKLKAAVYKEGPVSAPVGSAPLYKYKKGIIKEGKSPIDHLVMIVGYGEENGTEYWIVKNSWGSDWGEDGYFRVKRGSNIMNIESGSLEIPTLQLED
ncbi:unnamed protein product [Bursaphelenchus okinawaensis]|uniref:Uncharacterized protein n=1 Tax=Bursaphelenchus okinawaensis TaxID=465554 RepID=A0A811LR46_9BILA|nr:unnamed protein product [Bursaphelenchus okinawaensis]CAG9127293.1 unnamed protein product [Bursaphelenchus okinawaensis]